MLANRPKNWRDKRWTTFLMTKTKAPSRVMTPHGARDPSRPGVLHPKITTRLCPGASLKFPIAQILQLIPIPTERVTDLVSALKARSR